MTPIQQLYLGVGASKKTYVDDVFSTFLYKGQSTPSTVTTGIDMTEGGMVWVKNRSTGNPAIGTKELGSGYLSPNGTGALDAYGNGFNTFTSTGFTTTQGNQQPTNENGNNYASWSWKKTPGFFDVVTWTGNDTNRTISHSLGSIPGMIIVKNTSNSADWAVYHRSTGATKYIRLNDSDVAGTSSVYWNDTEPTATAFSIGTHGRVNNNGDTYVAYVFAGGESTAATARSVEFDGTNDQLLLETNSDLAFGTGDFTIEFWVKPQTLGYAIFIDMRPNPAATQGAYPTIFMENDILGYHTNSGTQITGNALFKDQWQHIALSRSGTSTKMFVNGTQVGSTYSDSTNYLNGDTTIGQRADGSTGDFDGYISNVRCVKGTAVYTSSFRPPTKPLANITNTKLLCCNNSSTTGSTVTPSTITADGTTASTDSPFDDPAGFVFGGGGNQNIIKTGIWTAQSGGAAEVYLGFEAQFIMIKTTGSGSWIMWDSMRGIISGGADPYVLANGNNAEASTSDFIDLTPTGFKVTQLGSSGTEFTYIAIRRPDGYVGKPADAGTDVFAMATGNSSGSIPNFVSGFPVDYQINRQPATSQSWYTGSRLTSKKYLLTDTNAAEGDAAVYTYDSNTGWCNHNYSSSYQAWMWKRHAGFDVVTYEGNGSAGHVIPHSMNKIPEMMWIRRRNATEHWEIYHKGLNGGTNPQNYGIKFFTNAEHSSGSDRWNAPTATSITVNTDNGTNNSSGTFIAMLFASVDGISKVGYFDGSSSAQTITTNFAPRFLIIRKSNGAGDWLVIDTIRGWASGNDNYMMLNSNAAQAADTDFGAPTSTGFTLTTGSQWNASGSKYIYYCHA